jgi:aminoglycoside 2''-phosphotransferase
LNSLKNIFPTITEEDLRFFYHGTYNVFEVKKKFIFRFPDRHFRNSKGVKLIKEEIESLKIIKKFVQFRIPEPKFFSFDANFPFMGYKKLEGIPLSLYFFKLDLKTKERIAKEIATFLSELHSPDLVKKFSNNNYSPEDYHQEWKVYHQKIQTEILPLLQTNQQRWVNRLFDDFLGEKENFKFFPKVVHGDFDTSNILFNPKTQHISGIVDFEETRVYDPAANFLFFREGDNFLEKIIENYTYEVNTGFRNRMKFLFGRGCLGYIEFGHMTDRLEMIGVGKKMLDERMKMFPTES